MGYKTDEVIQFVGYFAKVVESSFGELYWLQLPAKPTGVTQHFEEEQDVMYLLPYPSGNYARRVLGGEARFYVHTLGPNNPDAHMSFSVMEETMQEGALTGDAPPPLLGNKYLMTWPNAGATEWVWVTPKITEPSDCIKISQNGLMIGVEDIPEESRAWMYNPQQSNFPRVVMHVEYVEPEVWSYGPAGWIDITKDTRFFWSLRYDPTNVIGELHQESAVFRWKIGTAGEVHEVNLTTETEYTVPANTFPKSDQIYWQVVITGDNDEVSTNMDWTLLTAYDSIPTLIPVSPVGEYVEASQSVTFCWNYSIPTGTKQTAYELQVKGGIGDWTTVSSAANDSSNVTVDAALIPTGSVQWRVRAANSDGVFSEWSEPATFVAISAPDTPSLSVVEATPRPVIAWQSTGQQGFEAQIGSFSTGVVYGTAKQAKSAVYLPDGTVTARVRVVNEFGLWSEWSEIEFAVANVPLAGTIVLSVKEGTDAVLSWSVIGGASAYNVYRNGKKIATVSGNGYTDRLHLGEAVYFVRAVQTDGDYYLDSNKVAALLSVEHTMISPLGGEWIDLEFALTSMPAVQSTRNSDASLMRYAGHAYPMPEFSPQISRIYRINVAFSDKSKADAFDDLLGGLVVVKDQYGNFLVGLMESVQKAQNAFFTSYSAAISQVDEAAYENN